MTTTVISGKLTSEESKHYISQFSDQLTNDYLVLGIIGAQSSGKSTLLNYLFNTEFKVMDEQSQRKQTTKGIWTHVSTDYKLMLLDIEGADSRERWEERAAFEKRTALFGLVISNVLMINVWLQEIGRFSASNYEILKIIFELNLRFFKSENPKKIIFVIRDFNDRENLEFIKGLLEKDIEKLWSEVPKPDKYKDTLSKEVFELEVFPIHHFLYEKQLFLNDVDTLRDQLSNKASPNYIFSKYDPKNIPFDAMYAYMHQIWTTILQNKDINIPNQKLMIASYRCGEIKTEALKQSIGDFKALRSSLRSEDIPNLKQEYSNIIHKSLSYFRERSAFYDPSVVEENEVDLKQRIDSEFENIFKEQNEKLIDNITAKLSATMKSLMQNQNESSSSILKTITLQKDDAKVRYSKFLEHFEFDDGKKQEYYRYFNLKLSNTITGFLSSSANAFIKKLIRHYMKVIDDKIFETFQNLNQETWEEFNLLVSRYVENIGIEMFAMKRDYEDIQGIFTDELINSTQKDFLYTVKSNLQNRKLYINDYLLENFIKLFELNSSGARRNWRALSDTEIDKLFKISREKFLPTLKFLENSAKLEYDDDIVLSKEETLRIKNKFSNQINDVLENAFNKKYNRNSLQRVPKWLWLILAYFMHDNILEWMRNPIFFVLLIIGSTATGYIVATGKVHLVKQFITFFKDFVIAKALGTAPPKLELKEEEARTLEEERINEAHNSVIKEES